MCPHTFYYEIFTLWLKEHNGESFVTYNKWPYHHILVLYMSPFSGLPHKEQGLLEADLAPGLWSVAYEYREKGHRTRSTGTDDSY